MDYISELASAIRAELNPKSLPDEPVDTLLRSYAVLTLALGEDVTTDDVHNAWVAWMGTKEPQHPALVPLAQLDPAIAEEDEPFVSAIHAVARIRGIGHRRCR